MKLNKNQRKEKKILFFASQYYHFYNKSEEVEVSCITKSIEVEASITLGLLCYFYCL